MGNGEEVKQIFAMRLQKLMAKAGYDNAEMARRATAKGKKYDTEVNRDHVYRYINALTVPGPARLKALSDALGVQPDDLLPSRGKRAAASNDLRITGDNIRITLDREVPVDVASKILSLIEGIHKK